MSRAIATIQGVLLALAGVVATFLASIDILGIQPPCPRAGGVDCAAVLASAASRVGPVPTAGLGALYAFGMLALRVRRPTSPLYLWGAGAGLVAATGLQFYSRFVLDSLCLYCLLFWALLLGTCLAAALDRSLARDRLESPSVGITAASVGIALALGFVVARRIGADPSAQPNGVPDLAARVATLPVLANSVPGREEALIVADPECPLCRELLNEVVTSQAGRFPGTRLLLWPRSDEGERIARVMMAATREGRLSEFLRRYLAKERSSPTFATNVAGQLGVREAPIDASTTREAGALAERLRATHTPVVLALGDPPRIVPLAVFLKRGVSASR